MEVSDKANAILNGWLQEVEDSEELFVPTQNGTPLARVDTANEALYLAVTMPRPMDIYADEAGTSFDRNVNITTIIPFLHIAEETPLSCAFFLPSAILDQQHSSLVRKRNERYHDTEELASDEE